MCPLVEGPGTKLWAIVTGDRLRVSADVGDAIELFDDSGAREAQCRDQSRTVSVVLINDRQCTEPSPVFEPIGDEVHGPALVSLPRYLKGAAWLACQFFPSLGPHLELQFTVESVNEFLTHRPAFPLQEYR